jgi:hypothetical protein
MTAQRARVPVLCCLAKLPLVLEMSISRPSRSPSSMKLQLAWRHCPVYVDVKRLRRFWRRKRIRLASAEFLKDERGPRCAAVPFLQRANAWQPFDPELSGNEKSRSRCSDTW